MSSAHTSHFIEPFLRWLFPDIPPARLDQLHFLIRKAAHLAEYSVFSILLWRAMRLPAHGPVPRAGWIAAGWTLVITALYAASDEFHQSFVPSRGASVDDVMLDIAGALAGLGLLWATNSTVRILRCQMKPDVL